MLVAVLKISTKMVKKENMIFFKILINTTKNHWQHQDFFCGTFGIAVFVLNNVKIFWKRFETTYLPLANYIFSHFVATCGEPKK